jgi:PAS domain S-box-containing protein
MSGPEAGDEDPALARALEATMDGVAILEEGVYQYVNRSHAELYGYAEPGDLVGRNWRELYEDAERRRLETEVLPQVRETGSWRGEAVGRRQDGSTFHQELSLTRTDGGRLVCTVRDITDRKRRQESLELYETVLTNIHDGVYTLDPDGQVTWVNEVAVREFDIGYDREELVGAPVTMLLDQADIETSLALIEDLVENDPGGGRRCEVEIQTAYGDTIPCDLHLSLLPDEDGGYAGTLGVVRDITDRKRREQRLSVLNRVLRHNLRNDLNVMLMRLKELVEEYGIDDSRVDLVREKGQRLVEFGDTVRALDRRLERLEGEATTRDVADLVREQCEALREAFPGVTVEFDAPENCPARADEMADLAVENLLENAVTHGADTGGEGDADGATDPVNRTVRVSVEPGDRETVVRVADDGPGIPNAELEALAGQERALSHGSGFGLWVAKWCVEWNDGRLTIESPDEGGTVATIRLPSAQTRM